MRRTLLWLLLAACSSAPKAERLYYAVAAGSTFDGKPSTVPRLDASFADGTVAMSGMNQGFGVRGPDGTYDMVFYRHVPVERNVPQRQFNEVTLLVIHPDGQGAATRADRMHAAFKSTASGDDVVLDGQPVGHTVVHLAGDGTATLEGDLIATSAVYARFDQVLVIGVSSDVSYSDLIVGRYDFTHGRGETASPRGRGVETFTLLK